MLSFTAQRLAHLVRGSARFHRRTPLAYWIISIALLAMLLPGAGLSLQAPPAGEAASDEKPATVTTATVQIDGTAFSGDRVLFDEDPEITGQFVANPQTPVPAREVGSEAQRAAVAEIEKLGGAVYASRDKAGKVSLVVPLEAEKWKGGAAGLAHLKALDDLQALFIACKSIPADGLTPLKDLPQLSNLQLDNPSLEQLKSLNDWRGPKGLTIYGDGLSDDSLSEITPWLNLESLTIAGDGSRAKPPRKGITDPGIAPLRLLVHLKRLQLSGCQQVSGGTLGALTGLSDLRMLMLLDTGFDDRGLAELAKLTQIKHLILDVSKIGPAGFASLGKMTSLTRLSLNEARTFDDAAAAHLAPLKKLRALHLFDNKLTDAGLAALAGMTELRELQAWKGRFSDAGLAHLKGLTKLRMLRIDSESLNVGDEGLRSLAGLTQLQSLGLEARRVTDEGLAALAGLTRLRMLDLKHARIRGPGLAQLNGLSRLQHLILNDTLIDDEGLRSLPPLTKLTTLSLSDTKLTDAGLAPLAELPKLNSLTLAGTAITDAGLTTLVKLPMLRMLDLSNTKFTDAGLEKLVGAKALRVLLIVGTQVTAEGKKMFKQNHPDLDFDPNWVYSLSVNTFQTYDEADEESGAEDAGSKSDSGFKLDNN
jgi:Leucine-rich repeat (LRR) protein